MHQKFYAILKHRFSKVVFIFGFLFLFLSNTILIAQSNEWTWVKGENKFPYEPVYGVQGQTSNTNKPGGREESVSWLDSQGNLWVFGGYGYSSSIGQGELNDLWRFNPTNNQWTWMKGANTNYNAGFYGTQGVASVSNSPAARKNSVSWTDTQGKLWLFGGFSNSFSGSGDYNDLWRFDPVTNVWTWISGSNTASAQGVYGTQGLASINNSPGARDGSITWTDNQGKLWIFGGYGRAASSGSGLLNDLWRYDPVTNEWTWIKGADTISALGIYGSQGVGSPLNTPGSRSRSVSWTDIDGKLWLFGGYGYTNSDNGGFLNDVWCFDPDTNEWTWMKGANSTNSLGTYGTQGISSSTNSPGSREGSNSWTDSQGKLWLFGGRGNVVSGYDELNDLWRFDPLTNEWTWVKGAINSSAVGIYGTKGLSSPTNTPGSRNNSVSWIDSQGKLLLFGGYGKSSYSSEYLNDLWSFDPQTSEWTWLNGPASNYSVGIYGSQGVPSTISNPGDREGSVSWIDGDGKPWIFGGFGVHNSGLGRFNDLWRFDANTLEWTWIKGSNSIDENGVYGVKNIPSPSNKPGSRNGAVGWTDSESNLWLFGGFGNGASNFGMLNDLWRFNKVTFEWTWVKGSNNPNANGVYGSQNIPSTNNTPGARIGSISWTDQQGKLWLFGGSTTGFPNSRFNDLWRFDPVTQEWTWIKGSSSFNATGVYGIQGLASTSNTPGARTFAVGWVDDEGKFWLFGGNNSGTTGSGFLNDLWRFDPVTLEWTWIKGSNSIDVSDTYGTKGIPSAVNSPGGRYNSVAWKDQYGKLWLFGGNRSFSFFNDLWQFDPLTKNWAWVKGKNGPGQLGIYGTLGVAADVNTPGARDGAVGWSDRQGKLWLFGGDGYNSTGSTWLNDLWSYNPMVTLPSIALTSPNNNSNFPEGSTITVSVSANNPGGSISKVDFIANGSLLVSDNSSPYSYTATGVPAGTYLISANAITNLGDTMRANNIRITVTSCANQGSIYGEGYTDVMGVTVSDLTAHPSYPNSPSITANLTSFEYTGVGDNYGGRLRGYLCVPISGAYIFNVSGDDQAGLYLSTDDNPANKVLIAYAQTFTSFRQWNKFATQQSQPVNLIAGVKYYIETLHKEYNGQDHLSVAWTLPDGRFEGPIPGNRLSPFIPGGGLSPYAVPQDFVEEMRAAQTKGLKVSVLPNPSRNQFTISLKGESDHTINLMVTDILGRVIERRSYLHSNINIQLGQRWSPGIYIVQIQQGDVRKTLKLVKE